ncbi:hypothetical protein Mapa_017457 [Marchantia paleacea]|nr:hypothetical protein Mapa_017457 [Marchantia paleacea]
MSHEVNKNTLQCMDSVFPPGMYTNCKQLCHCHNDELLTRRTDILCPHFVSGCVLWWTYSDRLERP